MRNIAIELVYQQCRKLSEDKRHIFDASFIVPLLTGARGKLLHSQTLHVVKAGES